MIESIIVIGYFVLVLIDAVAVLARMIRRRPDASTRDMEQLDLSPWNGTARSSMTLNNTPDSGPSNESTPPKKRRMYGFI